MILPYYHKSKAAIYQVLFFEIYRFSILFSILPAFIMLLCTTCLVNIVYLFLYFVYFASYSALFPVSRLFSIFIFPAFFFPRLLLFCIFLIYDVYNSVVSSKSSMVFALDNLLFNDWSENGVYFTTLSGCLNYLQCAIPT